MMANRFLTPSPAVRVEFYEVITKDDGSHLLSACFACAWTGSYLTSFRVRYMISQGKVSLFQHSILPRLSSTKESTQIPFGLFLEAG